LYKDIPNTQGRYRDIYKNTLRIGSSISSAGNEFADKLLALCKHQNVQIQDDHEEYICFCRNNFVFYVSSSNDKYFGENNADDIKKVKLYIENLEKITDKSKYWYDINDTIIWAKLSLGVISAQKAKEELEALIKDKDITRQWKNDLQKRYDLYDMFDEHTEKVKLTL
jgi:hypothetical protein